MRGSTGEEVKEGENVYKKIFITQKKSIQYKIVQNAIKMIQSPIQNNAIFVTYIKIK